MEDFTLAKIAYEAYGAFTGWKTYNGRDMPKWDDLGLPIMRAWQAAAEEVRLVSRKEYIEELERYILK